MFYRDPALIPSSSSMMRPFSHKLWLAIAVTWLAYTLISITFVHVVRHLGLKSRSDATEVNDYFLFTFSSMTCQGTFKNTVAHNFFVKNLQAIKLNAFSGYEAKCRVWPLRITLLSSLVTGFFIQCVYNASVIAFLFVKSSFINSADDLPLHGFTTITDPLGAVYATSLFTVC